MEPNREAELWLVLAYNESEGGEAAQGLISHAPPVGWPKMTDKTVNDVEKEEILRCGTEQIPCIE